jgi:hypothetical protein
VIPGTYKLASLPRLALRLSLRRHAVLVDAIERGRDERLDRDVGVDDAAEAAGSDLCDAPCFAVGASAGFVVAGHLQGLLRSLPIATSSGRRVSRVLAADQVRQRRRAMPMRSRTVSAGKRRGTLAGSGCWSAVSTAGVFRSSSAGVQVAYRAICHTDGQCLHQLMGR